MSIDFICQAFAKKALSTILLNWAARSIVFLVLGRFVAFMLHPLVGLAVFFLTIIVSLVSDNPLQSWFKSNRMGKNYYIFDDQREWSYILTNYASAYGSYQKELDGLHEILETEEYKAKQQRDKQQLAAQQEFAEQNMQGGT